MAKITVEQVKKINSKCDNGFKLDIQYFLNTNEKILYKDVNINENLKIEVNIKYYPEYENSLGYNRPTGNLIPSLSFRKWISEHNGSMWSSTDWGKSKIISDERPTRKNISLLQKLTKEVTDELIRDYIIEFYGNIFDIEEVQKVEQEQVSILDMIM